jgi:hypothetical protein
MNMQKKKLFLNTLNNNNENKSNENFKEESKSKINEDNKEYEKNEEHYKDNNIQNINNYTHQKTESDNLSSNTLNYKYTKKKPKKIMKNLELILANLNENERIRYNTETIKTAREKKISNLKFHNESSRNNNAEKVAFSNTYTNFNFGEKNDKKTHNKIKIKSINYISNNDDQNQNRNFSQNESYRQYKVYKYISPSKNLFNKSNSNLIHKTWSNNFLYKKKNSFNNSMRKTKNYLKISKEYDDIDDELK